ncbi:MAG TPA: DUF3800 domain-containing protein [Candidatus Paceibacterota bacterium]
MEMQIEREKYFVFSDESGSWHNPADIYVRAWIVVPEREHARLVDALSYVKSELECSEVRWRTLAGNRRYFPIVDKFNFRIFLTISSPADIHWEIKYRLTRSFEEQMDLLDFGNIDDALTSLLKKKIYDDIRNVLFLHFYERTHIKNAKDGIERVLSSPEHTLIYRVDPPQMSKDGWGGILQEISPDIQLEFPKSHSDEGIQFADVVAGCVRSFLIADSHTLGAAKEFLCKIRPKLIPKDRDNPNPNLIFFDEVNDALKQRAAEIWTTTLT